MNYASYNPIDVVNGDGTRCTLFVSGCTHACKGCFNSAAQSFGFGNEFDQDMEDRILADLKDTRIKLRGLSLLGGEPLHPDNCESILRLVKRIIKEAPTKNIWIWTGYVLRELTPQQREIVDLIDVLIDGKFERSLADPSLPWRGSSNQTIYNLKPII